MPKHHPSVDSFGPQIMQLLLLGAQKQSEFTLPWRQAIALSQRLNSLRAAMRRAEHPMYPAVSRVRLTIVDHPDPKQKPRGGRDTNVTVRLGPADTQYDNVLAQIAAPVAPSSTGTAPTPPLLPPTNPATDPDLSLESILGLKGAKQ